MIPILNTLPAGIQTITLIILLITALIIAFKLMEMVFQTLAVTALSAGFYLGLVYLFNYPLNLNNLLFYSFTGATLYMAYKFFSTAYKTIRTTINIPYKTIKTLLKPFTGAAAAFASKATGTSATKLKAAISSIFSKLKNLFSSSNTVSQENLEKNKNGSSRSPESRNSSESSSSSDSNTKEVVLDKVMKDEKED
ncbi:MAG: hypothetical protein ABEJ83_01595 [Candidatus Nanohaloarchaea archaeon]